MLTPYPLLLYIVTVQTILKTSQKPGLPDTGLTRDMQILPVLYNLAFRLHQLLLPDLNHFTIKTAL